MRRNILSVKYIGSILLIMLLALSCKDKQQSGVAPRYTEHSSPAKVKVKFTKKSKLPELDFHIDNNNMRIFNKEYLPYQSIVDSAYLQMIISTEATVKILNETTKRTVNYLVTDTGKIDLTGGKLKISIEVKDEPTLIYDMRLLSYGYDPTMYTWKREDHKLPVAAIDSKVISVDNAMYWVGKDASNSLSIYEVIVEQLRFQQLEGANFPLLLNPSSLLVDRKNRIWGLDDEGGLYISSDLKEWSEIGLGDVKLTMLLSDVSKSNTMSEISAVGYTLSEEGKYYTYLINENGNVSRGKEALNERFPIRDAYVYSYTKEGIHHANILGGTMADGKPAPTSFFTSDGVRWGETPYSTGKQQMVPGKGGLFLRSLFDQSVYVVGGVYKDNKPSNQIKMSNDRGVTWKELTKQQLPGENFASRLNASGVILNNKGAEFYIFGGIIDGKPTKEIWHGWLDRTAGIINDFE